MHSTASDGVYPPAKLMQMARARGLAAVALTDHDTVAGLAEAERAASEAGLEFVPGIELAAEHGRGTLHLLGYFIDAGCAVLSSLLTEVVELRNERNRAIVERLARLGIEIDYERLVADCEAAAVGRPHIARAMVRCGAASNLQDAFDRYLGSGGAAYVERRLSSAETAIGAIRRAGGVASLAHPSQLGCESRLELETVLRRLMNAGLGAIESRHPDHTAQQTEQYDRLAKRFGLARTGGSDFHALGNRHQRGIGFGRVKVPHDWLATLRDRAPAAGGP